MKALVSFWGILRQVCRALVAPMCAAMAFAIAPAAAQTIQEEGGRIPGIPEPSISTSLPEHLADPGGVRSRLGKHGIQYGINYIGEVLGNPTGGLKQSAHYTGRLEVVVEADMEKMMGWKGLTFFTNGYWIHGSSISVSNIGTLRPVSFIEALPSTRLFELYLDQKLFDDKVSIRFGQLAADAEFLLSDGSGAFLNGTWGWPTIAAEDLPGSGPAYPLATPGVRLGLYPNDQTTLLVALYNGDPAPPCGAVFAQICNKHGLDFEFNGPPLLFAEGAFKYHQGTGQLPGTIKVGGWNHFGDFETLRDPNRIIDGNYGLYAIVDQMIYRMPGGGDPKGISVFGRVIGAPADRNLVDFYWEVGMTFFGVMPSRPNDILGIGFGYVGISRDEAASQREAGELITSTYGAGVEVAYTAEIVPGWYLQPDFQYFWNPGGRVADPDDPTKPIPDGAVLGLRTTINY
jgi:porin